MANILFIIPTFYIENRFAGGMGTKISAIVDGWGGSEGHNITVAPELKPDEKDKYDVIIIELLGLRNNGKLAERVEVLKSAPAPKIVYGSDSEIFRWTGDQRRMLQEIVSLWVPNMRWQADYFQDFDLPTTGVVYEPIDCDLFTPKTERKKIILAGGATCPEKQTEFFIELFGKLKGNSGEYKTAYLGDASLWGEITTENLILEKQLDAVTDNFYGAVKPTKVATVMSEAAVGVLNPHYETCNRFDMELMASGVSRVCGSHICYDERPTAARFQTVDDCIAQLKTLTNDFTALPGEKHAAEVREYAVEHFSYQASLKQLNTVLRYVL